MDFDTLKRYREIVKRVLTPYAKIEYANAEIRNDLVWDEVSDHYLIVSTGWGIRPKGRIHGCLVHIDIIDGKIWIQRDGTANRIVAELEEAGIPKGDIVLGSHAQHLGQHDYGAAQHREPQDLESKSQKTEEPVALIAETGPQSSAEKLVEMQTRILSASYDKAMAYTNLIIIAGYALFFGLWQVTRDYLARTPALWSAMLIAISAAIFALFEVTRMFLSSRQLLALNRIISTPEIASSVERMSEEYERYIERSRRIDIAAGRWWHITLAACVVTGIVGIGILWWVLLEGLIQPVE